MVNHGDGEPPVRYRRDWRELVAAFLGGALVAAVVTALIVHGTGGSKQVTTTAGSSTTPAPSGTSIPVSAPSSLPVTTPRTPVGTAPAPTAPGPVISGTVDDPAGHPLAGAYVIGLQTLTVVRTGPDGRYSMPCAVSVNGIAGNRAEPLVAATWLLPVQPTGQGSYAHGSNTTNYGPPPSTPGPGYVFSGGKADAQSATVVTCNGQPVNFVLPPGGAADIHFTGSALAKMSFGPVDNLYLPGLGDHAALETAPVSADGEQLVTQLGPGILRVDGVSSTLTCTGPGVTPNGTVAGADVTITAGMTTNVTCD